MDDHIHIVDQNPAPAPRAFYVPGPGVPGFQITGHLIHDGFHLRLGVRGTNDEIIYDSRQVPQIYDTDILRFLLQHGLGRVLGQFRMIQGHSIPRMIVTVCSLGRPLR